MKTIERAVVAAALWAVAAGLAVAAPATEHLPTRRVLPIAVALEAARGALAACAQQGVPISVAVVDRRGELELLAADPDVSPISVELSQRKARTAALFKARSVDVEARFKANPAYAQRMTSIDPRVGAGQGGVPILIGGELVGAMGASGAPAGDKDEACVNAGLAGVADRLLP